MWRIIYTIIAVELFCNYASDLIDIYNAYCLIVRNRKLGNSVGVIHMSAHWGLSVTALLCFLYFVSQVMMPGSSQAVEVDEVEDLAQLE